MMLTPIHEKILSILAQSDLKDRFYWTGGTLLSHYYLHHRKSFDLDFFTEKPFEHDELLPFIDTVKKALAIDHFEETKVYDRWEYIIPTDPVTRFEFVYYNHTKKRLAPLVAYRGILIDNLTDLAANKVMAYLDRNQPKDLLDVYFLLKRRKFTVLKLIALLEQKFGVHISEFTFWSESTKSLKQLESLRPFFLQSERRKQDAVLQDIRSYFLEGGAGYLRQTLDS